MKFYDEEYMLNKLTYNGMYMVQIEICKHKREFFIFQN